MLPKNLNNVTCADIEQLIENSVLENRSLEYKRDVGTNDKSKRAFLKSVSSMANSIGGDILYGIEEEKGHPKRIVGINVDNEDEEIRRLELLLMDGIQPRIPGVSLRWVPIYDSIKILVIRVPRSWIAPHRVTLSGHAHFYLRQTNSSPPMDVEQLRQAFTYGLNLKERVIDFHRERCIAIELNELPIDLILGAKSVLHLVPLDSFVKEEAIEFGNVEIRPIKAYPFFGALPTFEGRLWHSGREDNVPIRAYTLLFRNGVLESCHKITREDGEMERFSPEIWREEYAAHFNDFLQALIKLDLNYPYYLICSLVGMKGHVINSKSRPIKQEILRLPPVLLERKPDQNIFKPMEAMLRNAFGHHSIENFG